MREGTMNLLPRWMWTRTAALRRGAAAPEPDPGDMGTAFGLDASLGPPDEPVPEPGPRKASFWQQRLNRRPQR
jgi:hypothetical protein